jgi:hypothetical protein
MMKIDSMKSTVILENSGPTDPPRDGAHWKGKEN